VAIQYLRGQGEQRFALQQSGSEVTGMHQGELYSGTLRGQVHGDQVELHSVMEVPGNNIGWIFSGTASGSQMAGTLTMGEYGSAKWTAVRV
jgi:hypothetical protein